MQKKDGIRLHRGLLDPSHLTKWFGPTRGGVLVLDDLMEEGGQDKQTSSPGLFPQKMGGAGKGLGIGWSRVQPKYS